MGCGASSPGKVAPAQKKVAGKVARKDTPPPSASNERRMSVRRPGVSAEVSGDEAPAMVGVASRGTQKQGGEMGRHRASIKRSIRASVTLGGSTVVAQYDKSAATLEILKQATDGNPLFEGMNDDQRQVVYGAFVEEDVDAGDVIITQGDRGDLFYVVESGAFDATLATTGDQVVKHYERGTGFGELALLYNSPRAATVTCTKQGRIWAIDRAVFNMIMVASGGDAFKKAQEFLKTVDLMKGFAESNLDFLATLLEEQTFGVGDNVWESGTPVDTLYFVREGDIEIVQKGFGTGGDSDVRPRRASFTVDSFREKKHIILRRGDWFGSAMLEALLKGANGGGNDRASGTAAYLSPRGRDTECHLTDGRALGRVTVFALRGPTLRSAKEDMVQETSTLLHGLMLGRAQDAFARYLKLSAVQRLRLLKGLPSRKVAGGRSITATGHGSRLVFVIQGQAEIEEGTPEGDGDEGEEGEESAPAPASDPAAAPAAAPAAEGTKMGAGDCVDPEMITRKAGKRFRRLSHRTDVLAVGQDTLVVELEPDTLSGLSGLMSTVARRSDSTDATESAQVIVLDDLKQVAILGAGGYGYVSLVQHSTTKKTYALKKMSKPHIVAKMQVDHVNNERKLLSICDHPFLIALHGSFQDASNIYLLLERVLGGELFSYLDEHGPVGEDQARFYGGSVCAALEYLHDRNIIYRDLKPENLLLDSTGFIKVVDFGFAKVVFPGERTWTLCGTPEYLAPEVILRKGHDTRVDWWSLGILIIELIVGGTPFFSNDHFDIFKKIVRCKVDWESYALTPACEELCKQLLVTDPSQRLGGEHRDGRAVRESKFFQPLDFQRLVAHDLEAPYVPFIESEFDTRHCPTEDEIDLPDETFKQKAHNLNEPLESYFPEFEMTSAGDWDPTPLKK
jgi:serine/threonine protein kinase/CRP-like cAMP-binding protein